MADPNALVKIVNVISSRDRDYFFWIWAIGGTQDKVRIHVFNTRAQAEAAQAGGPVDVAHGLLAKSADTTWTGSGQRITCATQAGAAFDPALSVEVQITNSPSAWSKALAWWAADVEGLLVERAADLLELYTATNEALAACGVTTRGQIREDPPEDLVRMGGVLVDILVLDGTAKPRIGAQQSSLAVGLTLRGWVLDPRAEIGRQRAATLGATLRAIADTHRLWGQLAEDTKMSASMRPVVQAKSGDGFWCSCDVPLVVQFPTVQMFLDPTYTAIGSGGGYAWEVQQLS